MSDTLIMFLFQLLNFYNLTSLVGLIVAWRMRQSTPRPSGFAVIGFTLLFCSHIVHSAWSAFLLTHMRDSLSIKAISLILGISAHGFSLISAVALGFLLKAIYAGRAEAAEVSPEILDRCTVEVIDPRQVALPSPRFSSNHSEL